MKFSCFLENPEIHKHTALKETEAYILRVDLPHASSFGTDVTRSMVHTASLDFSNKLNRSADLVVKGIALEGPGIQPLSKLETYLPDNGDRFSAARSFLMSKSETIYVGAVLNGQIIRDHFALIRKEAIDWNEGRRISRYQTTDGRKELTWRVGACFMSLALPVMNSVPSGEVETFLRLEVVNKKRMASMSCKAQITELSVAGKEPVPGLEDSASNDWLPERFGEAVRLDPDGGWQNYLQRFLVPPSVTQAKLKIDFSFDGKDETYETVLFRDYEKEFVDGCIAGFKETG